MRGFTITTEIDAPASRVWIVMSDVDRWHEWTPSIRSVQRLGGQPLGIGSRALIRQPRFPAATWTVVAIEPGRFFTWQSVAPGLRVIGHHQVEQEANGMSRATLSLRLSGPLSGVFWALTRRISEHYVRLEAHGLKARSENPAFRYGSNLITR
jgi:uncharacterized membrane protein